MRACAKCGRTRPYIKARGLCSACYWWVNHHCDINEYPRRCRPVGDVIEDSIALMGLPVDIIAERIGYKDKHSLYRALHRNGRSDLWELLKLEAD